MNYSEKELLMLSNFVYLPASLEDGTISEILAEYRTADGTFTPESVAGAGIGGGLDSKQVSELFTIMQAECDSGNNGFGDLSAARRLEESDVRGICYTNKADENPVIVFRGTGGTTKAWQDNMYGSFETDTRIQKVASDFVKYECGAYENCTVTGHSKGGNLSQYVTIMNEDKIASCISFDGQGMNSDFVATNREMVEAASGKIKSISAYNDFVNILLTGVAGTYFYALNDKSGVNAHSSFYLLTSNEYDENGNFITSREQSVVASSMKITTDRIVEVIGEGNEEDNRLLCGILGEAVGSIVCAQDEEDVKGTLKSTANEIMLIFKDKLKSIFGDNDEINVCTLPSGGFYFDSDGVRRLCDEYEADRTHQLSLIAKTGIIKDSIDYSIATRFYTDIALARVLDDLADIQTRMRNIENVLGITVEEYTKRETIITSQMRLRDSIIVS